MTHNYALYVAYTDEYKGIILCQDGVQKFIPKMRQSSVWMLHISQDGVKKFTPKMKQSSVTPILRQYSTKTPTNLSWKVCFQLSDALKPIGSSFLTHLYVEKGALVGTIVVP